MSDHYPKPQEHLYHLLKDFPTAMLVSRAESGGMHARPMAVAELQPDADAYFATRIDSPKVDEILRSPDVLVTFQSATQFGSISGRATFEKDKSLIDRLWSDSWRPWFPGGKTDPSLVIIRVEAREGEYWDNSGVHGLKFLFEGLSAVMQGEKMAGPDDASRHAKVRLVSG